MTSTRDTIQAAAFDLFGERGYDATSAEDIAAAAGVSRSTFFRLFGSKEAVVFPDHDRLLTLVDARLRASTSGSAVTAVSDAVKLVLFHYVAEGDRARERYRLTSTVPALRERELLSGARYHQLFRRYISSWDESSPEGQVRAELLAAAIVAAHNRVLRRWLRGECEDPQVEIEFAFGQVRRIFGDTASGGNEAILVVVPAGTSMGDVAARVQHLSGFES